MRARTAGGAVTLVAATAALGGGMGTAAAAEPPADRGDLFLTEGAAYASLPAPDGSFYVHLSLFDGPGGAATAGVEVFGRYGTGENDYFECFDGALISATLDGLDGATAQGSTTLICSGPSLSADGTASVTVDVTWQPYGRVDRDAVVIPGLPCVSVNQQRAADVVGDFTVSISLPGVDEITAGLDGGSGIGDVRTLTEVCPRGRN